MSKILELMQSYNKAIERFHKAEKFFEANADNKALLDEHFDSFRQLLKQINTLCDQIKAEGYAMTDEERMQGFRQVKFILEEVQK